SSRTALSTERGYAWLADRGRGNRGSPAPRSGCPDLNWGPLRPERSALPGCATPRATRSVAPRWTRLRRLADDGVAERDRGLRGRAARDRTLPGVRAPGAPGDRRGRGDGDRGRRLVLARALRARGRARRRARARPSRPLLAQRAARRRRAAAGTPRGALRRRRVARRVPPR